MYIRLDPMYTNINGASESAHCVFRILRLIATMRNRLRHSLSMLVFSRRGEGSFTRKSQDIFSSHITTFRRSSLRIGNFAAGGSGGLSARHSIMALLKMGGAPIFWMKPRMLSIAKR